MPRSPDWYVDSGATAHMAPSSTTLDSSVPYHGREKVCFGNGNVLPSRIGTLSVNRNLKLQVVLNVPNITKKLLSDSATKAILATGTHKDGLYVLKTGFKALTSSIASPNKASFELWHKRLGHVAFDVKCTEVEQKNSSLKVDKLINKHAWITSEKQFFGRSGSNYDFISRDPHRARGQLENLEAQQADHEKRVNKKVMSMFEKTENDYNDLISKKNIIETDKSKIKLVIEEVDAKKKEILQATWVKGE
ncbi:structural maintenance of chromosomes protein 2-1-like protein [Tanacetum coccineum]